MISRAVQFLLVVVFALAAAAKADAQVLVYRLDFAKGKGINYHIFETGFFVAPLLGGTGSFLLATSEDGRIYTESADGGKFFTAINGSDKKAVMSASTTSGTATGSFVAIGDINHTLHVNSPTISLSARVARTLKGSAIAADDESGVADTPFDHSIGTAGFSEITMVLDERETDRANDAGNSVSQTITRLKIVLESEGYSPATATTTTTTGTTATTATQ